MPYRRLSLILVALLLSACGTPLIQSTPGVPMLPTAAVAQPAANLLPATPNHALIDTPVLDDLPATPPPTAPILTTPVATTLRQPTSQPQPTPQPQPDREPMRLVIDDIAM